MKEMEHDLRQALALPAADPNFEARVRAGIAASAWHEPKILAGNRRNLTPLLAGLNLAGAGIVVGLGLYGLLESISAELWGWAGLVAAVTLAGWGSCRLAVPARR